MTKSKHYIHVRVYYSHETSTSSFDIDLPVECDDEYWIKDDQDLTFNQPSGKPSTITMFNCVLHLSRILAEAYHMIVRFTPRCVTLPLMWMG